MSLRWKTVVTPALLALGLLAGAGCGGDAGSPPARAGALVPAVRHPPARRAPTGGSRRPVLPGPVLIADRGNSRLLLVDPRGQVIWRFPQRGDLQRSQSFRVPDDAFFSADGRQIIATQEDESVVTLIDLAERRIVFRYGVPGLPGSGPNRLSNPDDALLLPGGFVLTADIKNCRLLLIKVDRHRPARVYGTTSQNCYHAPPGHWGSPNGAFPMRNGHFLVTEINGDWVDELTLAGTVVRSWHPPGFSYPSDSNEVRPGVYLSVDYTSPGAVETFDRRGAILWRYRPRRGDPPLDHPSLAEPLPNGDVLVTDDDNNRVIVIDPRDDRIVWQYGRTGRAGSAAGYLNDPDGIDLAPPYSLLARTRRTIGRP